MSLDVTEIYFELNERPLGFDVEDDPEGDHILVRAFTLRDSLAERKGIRVGDRIEKLNGSTKHCINRTSFTSAVRELPEGASVKLTISRPSHAVVNKAALQKLDFTFREPGSLGAMLTGSAVTVDDGTADKKQEQYAIQVTGFQSSDSSAAKSGLRAGDVLQAVNGQSVAALDYDAAMQIVTSAAGARPLTLSVLRVNSRYNVKSQPQNEAKNGGSGSQETKSKEADDNGGTGQEKATKDSVVESTSASLSKTNNNALEQQLYSHKLQQVFDKKGKPDLQAMSAFQLKKMVREAGGDPSGSKSEILEHVRAVLGSDATGGSDDEPDEPQQSPDQQQQPQQEAHPQVESTTNDTAGAEKHEVPVWLSEFLDGLPAPQRAAVEAVQTGSVATMSPFKIKKMLRENSLDVSGSKDELTARLKKFADNIAGDYVMDDATSSDEKTLEFNPSNTVSDNIADELSTDDTASTATAQDFRPTGWPGRTDRAMSGLSVLSHASTMPVTPPPEEEDSQKHTDAATASGDDDNDAQKGDLVAAALELGERLAGKDVRTMPKEELTEMAALMKRRYGGETAKQALSAAFSKNVQDIQRAQKLAKQKQLLSQIARQRGKPVVMPQHIRSASNPSPRNADGSLKLKRIAIAQAHKNDSGLGGMEYILENLLLRSPPQYFVAERPEDLPASKVDFNYVCVNLCPSYEGETYRRAVEDPSAVLSDRSLTTTLTLKVDRSTLADFVLSSADSAMPHTVERWSSDIRPKLSLLNPMEHKNRLVIGDIVVAFGGFALAGASDKAVAEFIADHLFQNNNNADDGDTTGDSDDSDDDDDPFGDGHLLTVIVMRSLAVHVAAIQARLDVAHSNLSQLLAQGFAPKKSGDRDVEHPVRAAVRAFRMQHAGSSIVTAASALAQTVRETVFWNYILSVESKIPDPGDDASETYYESSSDDDFGDSSTSGTHQHRRTHRKQLSIAAMARAAMVKGSTTPTSVKSTTPTHGKKMSISEAAEIATNAHRSIYTTAGSAPAQSSSLATTPTSISSTQQSSAQPTAQVKETVPAVQASEEGVHRYSNSSFAMLRRMSAIKRDLEHHSAMQKQRQRANSTGSSTSMASSASETSTSFDRYDHQRQQSQVQGLALNTKGEESKAIRRFNSTGTAFEMQGYTEDEAPSSQTTPTNRTTPKPKHRRRSSRASQASMTSIEMLENLGISAQDAGKSGGDQGMWKRSPSTLGAWKRRPSKGHTKVASFGGADALPAAESIDAVFHKFDVDGDGKISSSEMVYAAQTLGIKAGVGAVQDLLDQADADGDGNLTKEEFRDFYSQHAASLDLAAVTRKAASFGTLIESVLGVSVSLDVDRNLINQAVSPRGTQKANSFVNLFAGGDNDPSDDAAAVARRAQHAEELAAEHAKLAAERPVAEFLDREQLAILDHEAKMLGGQQHGYIQLQDLPDFFRNVAAGLVRLLPPDVVDGERGTDEIAENSHGDVSSKSEGAGGDAESDDQSQDRPRSTRRPSRHKRYNSTGTAEQVVEITDSSHSDDDITSSNSDTEDMIEAKEQVSEQPQDPATRLRTWVREAEATVLQSLGVHADEAMRSPAVRVPLAAIDAAFYQVASVRKFAFVSAAFGSVTGPGGLENHKASKKRRQSQKTSSMFPEGALLVNSVFLESDLATDGIVASGDRIVAVNGRFGCAVPNWGAGFLPATESGSYALHDMVGEVARSLHDKQKTISLLVQVRVPDKFLLDGSGNSKCNGIYARIHVTDRHYPHAPEWHGQESKTGETPVDQPIVVSADDALPVYKNVRSHFMLCAATLPNFCSFVGPAAVELKQVFIHCKVLPLFKAHGREKKKKKKKNTSSEGTSRFRASKGASSDSGNDDVSDSSASKVTSDVDRSASSKGDADSSGVNSDEDEGVFFTTKLFSDLGEYTAYRLRVGSTVNYTLSTLKGLEPREGDLLVDIDFIGDLASKETKDVVTVVALALEREKKELQPSKDKGLDASVLRVAQTMQQAEFLADSEWRKAMAPQEDGQIRGDYAAIDHEAFFARQGVVSVGETTLTLECSVKQGTVFRVAQFESYAVYLEGSKTAMLPLCSGDAIVAVLTGGQIFDMRGQPAERVASFLQTVDGAVQFVVIRGTKVIREAYFRDSTGVDYVAEYAEDMEALCGPAVGLVHGLVPRCVTAAQSFRFTLHYDADRSLGIDIADMSNANENCAFSAIVRDLEDEKSQAARVGLLPGDVIVHVGEASLRNLSFSRTMDVLHRQLDICRRFMIPLEITVLRIENPACTISEDFVDFTRRTRQTIAIVDPLVYGPLQRREWGIANNDITREPAHGDSKAKGTQVPTVESNCGRSAVIRGWCDDAVWVIMDPDRRVAYAQRRSMTASTLLKPSSSNSVSTRGSPWMLWDPQYAELGPPVEDCQALARLSKGITSGDAALDNKLDGFPGEDDTAFTSNGELDFHRPIFDDMKSNDFLMILSERRRREHNAVAVAVERMRIFLATPEGEAELLKESLLLQDEPDPRAAAYAKILRRVEADVRRMEREELPDEALKDVEREVRQAEATLENSEPGKQLLMREIERIRGEIPTDENGVSQLSDDEIRAQAIASILNRVRQKAVSSKLRAQREARELARQRPTAASLKRDGTAKQRRVWPDEYYRFNFRSSVARRVIFRLAYALHLRRLHAYQVNAFKRWKLVVSNVNLPEIPSKLMDEVDPATRNLVGPGENNKDITLDDYLLDKIEEENMTQDAIRLNFKRYKSDPRVAATVRRVHASQKVTRDLARQLANLKEEYDAIREKAAAARARDNERGWFWEGDDVLGALGVVPDDADQNAGRNGVGTTGFPGTTTSVDSTQSGGDDTRAYLYVHDVVDSDEGSNSADDDGDNGRPEYMRNTFASKLQRVERKKERKQGTNLEGDQYGSIDATWKLSLRPSVNTARPKRGQGKFGVGHDAAGFFERQREQHDKWASSERRFKPIAAFAGTVRAQLRTQTSEQIDPAVTAGAESPSHKKAAAKLKSTDSGSAGMDNADVSKLAMFRRYKLQLRRAFKKFAVKAGDGVLKLGQRQFLELGKYLGLCPDLVGKGLLVKLLKIYGADDHGFGGVGKRSSLRYTQFLRALCDVSLRVATIQDPLLQKFVTRAQVAGTGDRIKTHTVHSSGSLVVAKGVSLGFERNEYERRALHNAGVTLEEKLVVLFYRMDPTGRRFPDIVNIAMELKQGKLSYESEHLHSSASAKAPPSLPPRTSSRQSQRAKRTFDMEPSVSHQLRELFLKQCPRFTPEKMSSKVFMRLARKWGVMFDATNAVGELAFQKAATNVWKRKQIKKDKALARTGVVVKNRAVPLPTSLYLDFRGFVEALGLVSQELFPAQSDALEMMALLVLRSASEQPQPDDASVVDENSSIASDRSVRTTKSRSSQRSRLSVSATSQGNAVAHDDDQTLDSAADLGSMNEAPRSFFERANRTRGDVDGEDADHDDPIAVLLKKASSLQHH